MSKLVAVQGCTIEYETDPSSTALSLVATISTANAKVSSGGNKAYKDKITITVSAGSITLNEVPARASSATGVVPPGTIEISGTSEKTSSEGDVFVLEDDEGDATFVCTFTPISGPNPVPKDVKITAKVTSAGQNVLKVT